ncbi:hypothetical protein ElyMa_001053500 [Elysia marginata]|uniref:Reverse transcriptase domain-containing protein n=1 Tax=Elysia marginata TaxID=1093978 RepID=A0AAV4HQ68_9GAST|nr:hypothetical protein ElyMa_001053500 [Elysia marginata]
MRISTEGNQQEIKWALTSQLGDSEIAYHIAKISHSYQRMQEKTTTLNTTLRGLGLKINKSKTKILRLKTNSNRPVTVEDEESEDVDSFTYLENTIKRQGGIEDGV